MSEQGVVQRRPQEYELRCPTCGKPIVRWEVGDLVRILGPGAITIKGICRNRQCPSVGRERTARIEASLDDVEVPVDVSDSPG